MLVLNMNMQFCRVMCLCIVLTFGYLECFCHNCLTGNNINTFHSQTYKLERCMCGSNWTKKKNTKAMANLNADGALRMNTKKKYIVKLSTLKFFFSDVVLTKNDWSIKWDKRWRISMFFFLLLFRMVFECIRKLMFEKRKMLFFSIQQ